MLDSFRTKHNDWTSLKYQHTLWLVSARVSKLEIDCVHPQDEYSVPSWWLEGSRTKGAVARYPMFCFQRGSRSYRSEFTFRLFFLTWDGQYGHLLVREIGFEGFKEKPRARSPQTSLVYQPSGPPKLPVLKHLRLPQQLKR